MNVFTKILLCLISLAQVSFGLEKKAFNIAFIGDSTVAKKSGWGDALTLLFDEKIIVKNFAVGGRSSKSWLAENRLPAALKFKPDYVFIQFGHNGQPGKGVERETDPQTTYKEYLRTYIQEFKAIGSEMVILSSVTRRKFDEQKRIISTLGPWAQAAKEVAEETGVVFIDLHSISMAYHNQIGPEESLKFNPEPSDVTHFNEFGGSVIANLIAEEIKKEIPVLRSCFK